MLNAMSRSPVLEQTAINSFWGPQVSTEAADADLQLFRDATERLMQKDGEYDEFLSRLNLIENYSPSV